MKKNMLLALVFAISALLALSGCAPAAVANLMADVKAAEKPANPAEPDEAFRRSVGDFSIGLFREASKKNGNVLVSPASVYLALAMAANGADKETLTAMQTALAASGISLADLNRTSRDWMALLANAGDKTRLDVANSIWYRDGFKPDPQFLQTNADFFAAAARALDFSQPAAVETINGWVRDNTQGKIEKIVESIGADVVMYLINAVYFKADWMVPFEASKTREGTFTAPGKSSPAKFMQRIGGMSYLEGQGAKGVLLPYKDGRFAFLALLPDEGTDPRQWLGGISAEDLAALLAKKQTLGVDLQLPKFVTRFETSMKDALAAMGMGVAFDPDRADFSKMNADHLKNLYISEVKHKTFCQVDEKGTEAAAVTSVEVSLTSMPVSDKVLVFDRPFVYAIIDSITGLPLFLGILDDPAGP